MPLSKRSPSRILHHNQQMLLGKPKNPDFEGQAYWGNGMAKGKIKDPARKPLSKKQNLRKGSLRVFR